MRHKKTETGKSSESILPGIRIEGLCLYIEKDGALVLADLHLGLEEAMNRDGVFVPRVNFREIRKRLAGVFEKLKGEEIRTIIINGDLKHEFGAVSEQEWREVVDILELLQKQCGEIILIRGNHDIILGPLAKWQQLEIADKHFLKKSRVLVLHGHKEPESAGLEKASALVIGHDHPAITLREGAKSETYKCFMLGKWKSKPLVVMPSLNAVSIGTNMARESFLSPMLQQDLDDFEIWVVEDRPYYFGKLKALL